MFYKIVVFNAKHTKIYTLIYVYLQYEVHSTVGMVGIMYSRELLKQNINVFYFFVWIYNVSAKTI